MTRVIAIDGPAASGKSTTARLVADVLDYSYLDTGAMYRASALLCIRNAIPLDNALLIAENIQNHSIDIREGAVFIDDEDVSSLIRTTEISDAASIVSSKSAIRREMVIIQRKFGKAHNTVAEGRDMGTVVFPDADLKIYVIADVAIRVLRRWRELRLLGNEADYGKLLRSQLTRDYRDRNRLDSPLRIAPGAHILDSTLMTITEQASAVVELFRERMGVIQ
ncbi:MAG: (d)CMP kinase [Candidatus Fermentibacteraceae bacterium]|nr:(d)CMP kinase [Candidatus Fermentibacteraceae bacterium]